MGLFVERALRSAKRRKTTGIVLVVLLLLPAPATIGAYVAGAADARFVLTMYLGIAGVLFLIPLLLFRSAWRVRRDPYSHGLFKDRFGRFGDPKVISEEVEAELLAPDTVTTGDVKITANWLVYDAVFIEVVKLSELVWAYPKRTKHSVNFIPTGTTKSLCLHATGHLILPLEIIDSKNTTDLLALLQQRAPWAHYGYNDALADNWHRSFKQISEEVAARRDAMKSPAAVS